MLPGEVEIGKRTLANIRPPWIIKMGLAERARLSTASWPPRPAGWGRELKAEVGAVVPLLGTQVIILPSVPFYIKVAQAHDMWCPSGDMDNSQTPGRRPERCPKAEPGLHGARRRVGNVPAQVARDPRTWEDLLC